MSPAVAVTVASLNCGFDDDSTAYRIIPDLLVKQEMMVPRCFLALSLSFHSIPRRENAD
jgi:hypothetical protein